MTLTAGQRLNNPVAVLWDMDGTLVDSEKLWTIALGDYAAHRGGMLSEATRLALVGSNMTRSMRMLLEDIGASTGPEHIAEAAVWVEARMAELLRADLPWRPGAEDVLRGLRAEGLSTALVTSTIRSLTEIALDTLGRDAFDVTVCGDEVDGRNKPDPEPYARACRLLRVDPADCIAFEDSPTGVASAVAAGCRVVGVPSEVALEPGPGVVVLESLEQLDVTALETILTHGQTAL